MFGWTGSLFVVFGWTFFAQNKPQPGCIHGILGSGLWAIEGYHLGSVALVTLELTMMALGAIAYHNLGVSNGRKTGDV